MTCVTNGVTDIGGQRRREFKELGMKIQRRIGAMLAALAVLATASVVWAQTIDVVTSDPREHEEQSAARKPFRLSAAYAHRFEADLAKDGKFSTDTARLEFTSQTEFTKALYWDNLVFYEFNTYDFSNTDRGGWWKDIHYLTYIPSLRWKIDNQWSVFGGPVLQVAAESEADFGDGVTGGALVGFLWRRDANLSVGAGIAGVSRIEDKFGLAPIPLVVWKFAEGWTLRSGVPDFGARRGFGLELGWGTESWEIAGGAQFQRRRFRLDDDVSGGSPQADQRNGVGQETSAPVYAKFTLKLGGGGSVDLFAGVSLAGELKVEDKDGHGDTLDPTFDNKQEFDPAPIIGTRVNFLF
jgi:hypothetical protein